MGVQSLVRTLFSLTIVFIHIFPYINLSVWAQILTPCEPCIPLYLESLTSLPSPIMVFIQSILRVCGHSTHINWLTLMTACYNKSISDHNLCIVQRKKPFPIYCCGPVFLIVPSQCQVLTFYLLLLSFIWSNMSHMWDFVVWYNTDALTINLMCHKKHLFILCLKYQGISYWLGLQWLMPGGWGNKAVLGSDWAFCASRSATKIPMTSFSRIERVFLLANGRKHPEPSWGTHWRASPVPPPHSWVQESTVVIEYWR